MPDSTPDQYRIPLRPAAGEFRDRGSKFVAVLEPVRTEAAALAVVEREQRIHHKCNHHCYAYRLGPGQDRWRANDDGEPSGTAGRPILGQITKSGLSDVVIVVSRYFGGTKLGASGLINAYRSAAAAALAETEVGAQPITSRLTLRFGYALMTPVMSALSQLGLDLSEQDFGPTATVAVDLPRSRAERASRELLAAVAGVYLAEVDDDFTVPGLELSLREND